jgi:hypothetical protein
MTEPLDASSSVSRFRSTALANPFGEQRAGDKKDQAAGKRRLRRGRRYTIAYHGFGILYNNNTLPTDEGFAYQMMRQIAWRYLKNGGCKLNGFACGISSKMSVESMAHIILNCWLKS